ncbi:MAG: hypothetical protein FK733_03840 [Asgard group archaeon]|nr:hypothetical protein [Asgard group archaeon]
MVSEKQLIISTDISVELINKAVHEQTFPRRLFEQIGRAEAQKLKRKLDRITLVLIIAIILIASLIVILENTLDFIPDDQDKIYIPVILIGFLVIASVLLAIEYFLVKKKGSESLDLKLDKLNEIERNLLQLQKEDVPVYNFVKSAFNAIIKVDSKYFLNGLLLRYYVYMTEKEHEYSIDKLYKYLFLISTKKNILFKKILPEEEIEEVKSEIFKHLPNYELMLLKIKENTKLLNYFVFAAQKSLEIINQFKLTKGEFVLKRGKTKESEK